VRFVPLLAPDLGDAANAVGERRGNDFGVDDTDVWPTIVLVLVGSKSWSPASPAPALRATSPASTRIIGAGPSHERTDSMNSTVLFVIAAILVIVGLVMLFQGSIILGVVLILAGLLVGPGGYSVFRSRHA
jgi:drug/metabolite transporter (DMT)-like permease